MNPDWLENFLKDENYPLADYQRELLINMGFLRDKKANELQLLPAGLKGEHVYRRRDIVAHMSRSSFARYRTIESTLESLCEDKEVMEKTELSFNLTHIKETRGGRTEEYLIKWEPVHTVLDRETVLMEDGHIWEESYDMVTNRFVSVAQIKGTVYAV